MGQQNAKEIEYTIGDEIKRQRKKKKVVKLGQSNSTV